MRVPGDVDVFPAAPVRALMDAIPSTTSEQYGELLRQALDRGQDLHERFGLTYQDLGALAAYWALTCAIGFGEHADGITSKPAVIQQMETSHIIVQSALQVMGNADAQVQRDMTYAALNAVLHVAPFTSNAPKENVSVEPLCQWLVDGETCGDPAVTGLDHPGYDATQARVCGEHEPRKCPACEGHIINGECHCE